MVRTPVAGRSALAIASVGLKLFAGRTYHHLGSTVDRRELVVGRRAKSFAGPARFVSCSNAHDKFGVDYPAFGGIDKTVLAIEGAPRDDEKQSIRQ